MIAEGDFLKKSMAPVLYFFSMGLLVVAVPLFIAFFNPYNALGIKTCTDPLNKAPEYFAKLQVDTKTPEKLSFLNAEKCGIQWEHTTEGAPNGTPGRFFVMNFLLYGPYFLLMCAYFKNNTSRNLKQRLLKHYLPILKVIWDKVF